MKKTLVNAILLAASTNANSALIDKDSLPDYKLYNQNQEISSISRSELNILSQEKPYNVQELRNYMCEKVNSKYCSKAIPLPPSFWLFASGLIGITGISRRKKN